MDSKISVRVRLVVVKNGKVLVSYNSERDFYFYLGGHMDYGETMGEACVREIKEECGNDIEFSFQKILYIRDFIEPKDNEHSLELFILGDINKFEELEKKFDPQHGQRNWSTWLDINNLPDNLYPRELSKKFAKDFEDGFPKEGEYIGKIK